MTVGVNGGFENTDTKNETTYVGETRSPFGIEYSPLNELLKAAWARMGSGMSNRNYLRNGFKMPGVPGSGWVQDPNTGQWTRRGTTAADGIGPRGRPPTDNPNPRPWPATVPRDGGSRTPVGIPGRPDRPPATDGGGTGGTGGGGGGTGGGGGGTGGGGGGTGVGDPPPAEEPPIRGPREPRDQNPYSVGNAATARQAAWTGQEQLTTTRGYDPYGRGDDPTARTSGTNTPPRNQRGPDGGWQRYDGGTVKTGYFEPEAGARKATWTGENPATTTTENGKLPRRHDEDGDGVNDPYNQDPADGDYQPDRDNVTTYGWGSTEAPRPTWDDYDTNGYADMGDQETPGGMTGYYMSELGSNGYDPEVQNAMRNSTMAAVGNKANSARSAMGRRVASAGTDAGYFGGMSDIAGDEMAMTEEGARQNVMVNEQERARRRGVGEGGLRDLMNQEREDEQFWAKLFGSIAGKPRESNGNTTGINIDLGLGF